MPTQNGIPWIGASMIYDGYRDDKLFYHHAVGHSVTKWAKRRLMDYDFNRKEYNKYVFPMIDLWARISEVDTDGYGYGAAIVQEKLGI